jgi:hypothetical protein
MSKGDGILFSTRKELRSDIDPAPAALLCLFSIPTAGSFPSPAHASELRHLLVNRQLNLSGVPGQTATKPARVLESGVRISTSMASRLSAHPIPPRIELGAGPQRTLECMTRCEILTTLTPLDGAVCGCGSALADKSATPPTLCCFLRGTVDVLVPLAHRIQH